MNREYTLHISIEVYLINFYQVKIISASKTSLIPIYLSLSKHSENLKLKN